MTKIHSEAGQTAQKAVSCQHCPLRLSPAFKDVPQASIAAIEAMRAGQLSVSAGNDIVLPGEQNANLYTLFSGWAYRYKELEDGRLQILNFLLPGDLVGLQAAMFEPPRHGIVALTDSRLCRFPRGKVWKLFGSIPDLAFDITWLGAREESFVDQNMLSVGRLVAEERVAALVLMLFKRLKALNLTDGMSFEFPLTQQHMADALGLSLAHLNKTVAQLKRKGLFEIDGDRMTLKNPKILQRTAHIYDDEYERRPLI